MVETIIKEKEENLAKQILDRWGTCVIPKNALFLKDGQPQVNQDKAAHYEERNYQGDEVLWIAPKDCLRLEFEDAPEHNHRYILEMESVAKSLKFDYCVTGHGGKSDYFNVFNIKAMPTGEDNKIAKLLLVDLLMPAVAKDQLDRTNLGWTLSPIIGHKHWKPKYNGAIHKILRGKNPLEHENKYPKELLKQIKKTKEWSKEHIIKTKQNSSWVEDFLLNYCCNNPLPKGSRHFIIEKNLTAFIIFRNDKEEIKEKYYKTQERRTDTLRTWEAAILKGDYTNVSAGELFNFIKEHNLNYNVPTPEKELEEEPLRTSLYINEKKKMITEQIYDGKENKFCIYINNSEEKIIYQDEVEGYLPLIGEEITKGAILLPSKVEEYGTDEELDKEILEFITRWLDIPDDLKQFGLWNAKRSWVFEKFHTLNYLRALGETGQGKTRFLDVFGAIHYKPIATSGATTAAPVFRVIEKWKGTLIMDEADFNKSDESQDIIKIINMGYERGKFVMRCDQNNAEILNFFDPYCPKILATRKTFQDKATESRCITQVMSGTQRLDIPLNLNLDFFDTAQKLRNKLLLWRFRNYFKIDSNKEIEFDFGDLEPRVKQIVSSFIHLFSNDAAQLEKFKEFIKKHQADLIEERQNSFVGIIVGAIHNLVSKGELNINNQDIINEGKLTNKEGKELKPQGLHHILKNLGFPKAELKKVNGVNKRCIPLKNDHLGVIFKRFGYDGTMATIIRVTLDRQNIIDNYDQGQKEIKKNDQGGVAYNRSHRSNRSERSQESENTTIVANVPIVAEQQTTPINQPISSKILEITKHLSNTYDPIPIENIVETALTLPNFNESLVERGITQLLKEGLIFEPRSGFIKLL